MQKLLTFFFSAKILAYMPYFMIKAFNDTLTNDIVSFEQLGPVLLHKSVLMCIMAKIVRISHIIW